MESDRLVVTFLDVFIVNLSVLGYHMNEILSKDLEFSFSHFSLSAAFAALLCSWGKHNIALLTYFHHFSFVAHSLSKLKRKMWLNIMNLSNIRNVFDFNKQLDKHGIANNIGKVLNHSIWLAKRTVVRKNRMKRVQYIFDVSSRFTHVTQRHSMSHALNLPSLYYIFQQIPVNL